MNACPISSRFNTHQKGHAFDRHQSLEQLPLEASFSHAFTVTAEPWPIVRNWRPLGFLKQLQLFHCLLGIQLCSPPPADVTATSLDVRTDSDFIGCEMTCAFLNVASGGLSHLAHNLCRHLLTQQDWHYCRVKCTSFFICPGFLVSSPLSGLLICICVWQACSPCSALINTLR